MGPVAIAGRALAIASFGALAAAAACSTSVPSPSGSGDDVTNDTRDAESRPPPNPTPEDAGPDAPMGPVYGDAATSYYPGVSECGGCSCAASTGYCFGGATLRQAVVPFAGGGDGGGGEGGLPACPIVDAGASAPALGCNALPSGCTDCACVISHLQPSYSCYLVCASDGAGQPITVYCPNQ
jgi:hypothetical protein